jgi:hypothetical protein
LSQIFDVPHEYLIAYWKASSYGSYELRVIDEDRKKETKQKEGMKEKKYYIYMK